MPITRDDLVKPGAVFIFNRLRHVNPGDGFPPDGTRLVLERDEGDTIPLMRREDGEAMEPDGPLDVYLTLDVLSLPAPSADTTTITIPRRVAEVWVSTIGPDSTYGNRSARAGVIEALRAALEETDPAVLAARALLESKGFTVARRA